MAPRRRSTIWNHFVTTAESKAKCNHCSATISVKNYSTGNLSRHLKTKHAEMQGKNKGKNIRIVSARVQTKSPVGEGMKMEKYYLQEEIDDSTVLSSEKRDDSDDGIEWKSREDCKNSTSEEEVLLIMKESHSAQIENADLSFLRSLLPDVLKMDATRKRKFKKTVLELIDDILAEQDVQLMIT